MPTIPQNLLDALNKAEDSKLAADTADAAVAPADLAVHVAQKTLDDATAKSLDAHKAALADASDLVAIIKTEFGLSA